MTSWWNFIQKGDPIPEWPYPVRYGKETRVSADVLVLGGGIAGCHAALSAARRGASVIMVEKGAARRSGQGGAGVDHWQAACTNPCSTTSPEEYARAVIDGFDGYDCGPLRYTQCRESWDAALDCERMGVQIRDVHGEFEGAEFRDPVTGLLFAYDYESRHDLRVYGHDMKPCLHKEVVRRHVKIFDRVMATALLTGNGRDGAPVVGATGVNVRTGEFYVFRAKATVGDLKTHAALQTRVGIATGLVVVGDLIGSGESQERAIVGETPNLAARLQVIAEPNSVVIAESTRKLLGNLFELEDLGANDLKGISRAPRSLGCIATLIGRKPLRGTCTRAD